MSNKTKTNDNPNGNDSELLPLSGSQLIEMVRVLEVDHKPEGWPAIQMKHVSTLADYLEHETVRADAYMAEAWRLKELSENTEDRHGAKQPQPTEGNQAMLQTMEQCLDCALSDNGNADKIKVIRKLLYTEIGRIKNQSPDNVVKEALQRGEQRDRVG